MFFLIMLIGYICRKIGVFKDTTGKTISSIVINIGNPALIIASGMNPERLENKGKLLFTLGVALIYFAIMFAVAELLPRLLHADREDYGAYQVMMLFSNIGFMGYPLLDVMYGSNAIIHAVIFNLLYNVLIYTYGIHKMQIGGCQKNINWKQLVNIGVGSCIIAIVLYITNLPVPLILEDTATFTGAITGPLSMLVIGDSLAQTRLRDLFTDVRLLVFSVHIESYHTVPHPYSFSPHHNGFPHCKVFPASPMV
jgi:malate permease and related proteins